MCGTGDAVYGDDLLFGYTSAKGVVAEGFCYGAGAADQAVDQVIEALVTVFAGTVACGVMAVAVGDEAAVVYAGESAGIVIAVGCG